MRVIGPNCLGVMNPLTGLNATFASAIARPGSVAFISQSGALCTAVLDWSLKEMVGFSAFVSVGSMVDVGWGDLIYHLGNDPKTRSIVIYMETIGDARAFLSAAREVALTKPIIVIKAGRTAAGGKAAASHTGSMTGSDDVLEAAFRRSGVLRVGSMSELFYMAEVLAKQPRPKGPRLTILTNAGGPAVLATDTLINSGGELAEISPETMAALSEVLPETWSHNNPIDIIGDVNKSVLANPDHYPRSGEALAGWLSEVADALRLSQTDVIAVTAASTNLPASNWASPRSQSISSVSCHISSGSQTAPTRGSCSMACFSSVTSPASAACTLMRCTLTVAFRPVTELVKAE